MPFIRKSVQFQVFFLILSSLVILPGVMLAAEESITLTTYYPSPYGVYSEMRLYPKSGPNTPCQEGTMYYDSDEKALKVCDVNGIPQPAGGGYWKASTSNPNDIYNTNSGRVGIGTSTMLGFLSLARGTSVTDAYISFDTREGPDGTVKRWGEVSASQQTDITDNINGGGMTDNSARNGWGISFGDNLDAFQVRRVRAAGGVGTSGVLFSIINNGNVGIGTTGPAGRLHVQGANDAASVAAFMPGTDTAAPGAPLLNVGIGTTAPATRLEVKAAHADTELRLFSDQSSQGLNGVNTANLNLWASEPGWTWTGAGIGNNAWILDTGGIGRVTTTRGGSYIRLLDSSMQMNVINSTGTVLDGIFINSAGNVGIGATDPTQKLDINGQVRIRGGSPGPRKVLASSDTNGVAVWKSPGVAVVQNSSAIAGVSAGYVLQVDATCPADTVLVGCSGSRDDSLQKNCPGCDYIGTLPISQDTCRTAVIWNGPGSGAVEAVAHARCLQF